MKKNSSIAPYVKQGLIAIVVIVIGFFVFTHFVTNSETAKKFNRVDSGILIEVETVNKADHIIKISGTGQVQTSRSQNLKSEANGRVTWISDQFYPGAKLKKGTVIAKINTEEYAIRLSNAKIQLRQREVSLMLEEAKGRAAASELATLQKTMTDTELTESEANLVKRQPQLQSAIADVELAKNTLKQAQIDYNKSIIKLPYDAVIETTNISIGDYISGGTQLGTIIDATEFWVYLSLNPANVGWLELNSNLSDLKAEVKYEIGGQSVVRQAKVKSVQPSVENLGRMVQVLLSIEDPLGEPAEKPLLIGSFVNATIFANQPLNSIELPRAFVREGNLAYVCTPDNKLSIRKLTTPFKTNEHVYVTEGLENGERIVTTLISSPVEGRKLRIKGEEDQNAPEGMRGGPEGKGRPEGMRGGRGEKGGKPE